MATNLRLRPDTEAALRAEAARTGRSQQDIIREAVDSYLSHAVHGALTSDRDLLIAAGRVRPPRTPYRRTQPRLAPPTGSTTLDLLDRAERVWVRVYVDSSALLKHVVAEAGSDELVTTLDDHHDAGDLLVSSSLAWIEVTRVLRTLADAGLAEMATEVDGALSGVTELPMTPEVIALARRVNPARSLDAVHLASALLLDVDVVLTYDERLAVACTANGLSVAAPGVPAGESPAS